MNLNTSLWHFFALWPLDANALIRVLSSLLTYSHPRKFRNEDGSGDPTAFFNDIHACLRLPRCDQLMILDCCYSAKAFAPQHIGKRKFELMASAAHDRESPAPHLPHSFTNTLQLLETSTQRKSKRFLYLSLVPRSLPHHARQ